jgi:cytidine deaminase
MLSADDHELVLAAQATIRAHYRPGWHVVGAALRLASGQVFTGVHLEATVGRIAVCAEAVALGRAVTEVGRADVMAIAAVYCTGDAEPVLVPPCGMCRELIADYGPAAQVILPDGEGGRAVPIATLIPHRFAHPVRA